MTYHSFTNNPSADAIDVQLHYDRLSGTAYACSTVFDGCCRRAIQVLRLQRRGLAW